MAAGRFSGVNPASQVIDMGCGYGDGACTLAREFRCRVTAIDSCGENIVRAKHLAVERGVSHLITFENKDLLESDYSEKPVELVLAEGGVFSFISRARGLSLASAWLQPRGWLAFSDLILLSDKTPDEIKTVFEVERFQYEAEDSYRQLVNGAGFDIHFMCLVPRSGWDNYYAHMAKRLEDDTGFFADKKIKLAFHREIDVFYRLEGFRYVGYLFCIARKRS